MALLGGVCALRLAMGLFAFPIVDGDGVHFWPSALSYAHGHGLTNTFHPRVVEVDPAGEGRLAHGFLHPILLGLLARDGTPRGLHVVESILQALTLAVSTRSFAQLSARAMSTAWRAVAATGAGALAVASCLVGLTGRPETLVMLFVALGVAVTLSRPEVSVRWLATGALLGATAATDPPMALVAGVILAVHVSIQGASRLAVFRLVQTYAGAAATLLALSSLLYPYGLRFWILSLQRHASLATGYSEAGFSGIPRYWLFDGRSPLLLITLSYALAVVSSKVFRTMDAEGLSRWTRYGVLAVAAVIGAYVLGHRPEQVYYTMSLTPLWGALIITGDPTGCAQRIDQRMRWRELAAILVLSLAGSGTALAAIQFHGYRSQGVSLDEAKQTFETVRPERLEHIAVTGGLWALADDPAMLRMYGGRLPTQGGPPLVIILQQVNTGRVDPPNLPGYRIFEDRFVRVAPRFFGIPYGRTVKSYAFAAYRSQP